MNEKETFCLSKARTKKVSLIVLGMKISMLLPREAAKKFSFSGLATKAFLVKFFIASRKVLYS